MVIFVTICYHSKRIMQKQEVWKYLLCNYWRHIYIYIFYYSILLTSVLKAFFKDAQLKNYLLKKFNIIECTIFHKNLLSKILKEYPSLSFSFIILLFTIILILLSSLTLSKDAFIEQNWEKHRLVLAVLDSFESLLPPSLPPLFSLLNFVVQIRTHAWLITPIERENGQTYTVRSKYIRII